MIEKLDLFNSKRDFVLFIFFISIIFGISLFFQFQDFKSLKSKDTHHINVVSQYIKMSQYGEEYSVLKFKYKSINFYSVSFLDIEENIQNIKITANFSKLTFWEYINGFSIQSKLNMPSIILKKHNTIENFIESQHSSVFTKELFLALFLAKVISKETRDKISNFGVAHLVAISGFHLGFLGGILFGIISLFFKLTNKIAPYQNQFTIISLLVFSILFVYMYYIYFPASLIRAYSMMIVIFILYTNHINLFSFGILFVASLFAIAIFPILVFSLSFWFSVFGVFIIYLYIKYVPKMNKILYLVGLNVWVFLLMQPIAHTFFDKFTFYQLYSAPLSILFILFYPLEILIHLFGYGDLLDSYIEQLFFISMTSYHFEISTISFICYVVFLGYLAKR